MATYAREDGAPASRLERRLPIEFHLIYLVSFVFFLVRASLARLVPGASRAGTGAWRTLLEEAKASASTCAAFAFMG